MPADSILQIKVTLADIRPPIWRRLQVPAGLTLARLHLVIQTAMGWEDYHMHLFATPAGDYGRPDSELGHRNEAKVPLHAVAPAAGDKICYTYDFGDGWEHVIEVEKVLPRESDATYPHCLTGRRACPPEDCGGPWGYGELLAALADPKHEQHDELTEWIGGSFDPDHLDIDDINKQLADI
ncbi:plasmid pRiA4b ORF-3 family protein [Streptomyces boncukensis]|uniref:Plasmid pRiA4b ORF-3 family protein n=1 Tax=Streptomyces boncukensis TaxID=2711219 RepID=A0A6G4X8T0_9ACTN|nr:plasmid pRiA4b ORF-3 family protein [Streptomyces boncukensis]NGO73788.1 plasmid pRiA4b ORF-3 family protein [Streptomyces boncukensis]